MFCIFAKLQGGFFCFPAFVRDFSVYRHFLRIFKQTNKIDKEEMRSYMKKILIHGSGHKASSWEKTVAHMENRSLDPKKHWEIFTISAFAQPLFTIPYVHLQQCKTNNPGHNQ